MLPSHDIEYLNAKAPGHQVTTEGGVICVLVPAYPLPKGFDRDACDLLIRLAPGYPDVPPDMWWFDPAVRRVDGKDIEATQVTEAYLGRSWQRWSRHLTAGQWNAGSDSLEGFLALVQTELDKAARTPVQ